MHKSKHWLLYLERNYFLGGVRKWHSGMSWLSWTAHLLYSQRCCWELGTKYSVVPVASMFDLSYMKPELRYCVQLMWLHLLQFHTSVHSSTCSTTQLWKALKYCCYPVPFDRGSKPHFHGNPYHLLPLAAREMKGQGSPVVTLQCNKEHKCLPTTISWDWAPWYSAFLHLFFSPPNEEWYLCPHFFYSFSNYSAHKAQNRAKTTHDLWV